jgi:DNA repair exonuclease SbcCD nuclease subunit
MITDTHFGIYLNDLDRWLDMMSRTFREWLFPYLRANVRPGDIMIHLGDLFDNRTSIPINVMNEVEKLLLELSEILPVHIIVGNHDLWNKGTNDVNSVRLYSYLSPDIYTYQGSVTLDMDGRKLVLMPWVEKRKNLIKAIQENPGDYLFCHSDLNGCRMHLNSVAHRNPDKIGVDEFAGYSDVFSGHIHITQKNKNFRFIGSLWQMDRNDINDQKGITVLTPVTGEVEFVPNTYSPQFRKLRILQESDVNDLDREIGSKDYIDLLISNKLLVSNRKLEAVLEKGSFSSVEYLDDIVEETKEDPAEIALNEALSGALGGDLDSESVQKALAEMDYGQFIRTYITAQTYGDGIFKEKVLEEYDAIVATYKKGYQENVETI